MKKKVFYTKPKDPYNRIAIVGDAPDADDISHNKYFSGAAGRYLGLLLDKAGISREHTLITNVFTVRPPKDEVGPAFFIKKGEFKKLKKPSPYPDFGSAGFLNPIYEHELERLKNELETYQPTLIIALGAAALWALTGFSTISNYRGTFCNCTLVPSLKNKVLPTYHPSALIKQHKNTHVALMDFRKALKYKDHAEITFPERTVLVPETIAELEALYDEHLKGVQNIVVDIETIFPSHKEPHKPFQITCLGLAPSSNLCITIPFYDNTAGNLHYWYSFEDEYKAWNIVKRITEDPSITKTFQNGLYDIVWLRRFGVLTKGSIEDTMLVHHALDIEAPKALDFLSSKYCLAPAWKNMVDFKASAKVGG